MDSPTPDPYRDTGGDPDALPDALPDMLPDPLPDTLHDPLPEGLPDALSDERVHHLQAALLAHFDARARDLPWRRTDDPYGIWVSEIMLQQTRVDTVVPYYERWMDRFPDVDALAAAELDEVLKHWEGLGYYRRARMLHRAAVEVRDRGGTLPDTAEGLKGLPGIGDYTAGAVASIAFGRPEPAVDGNVRRVLARLFDLPDPSPSELRALAAALVPAERPGDFNQAVMELGATVCTPRDPDCGGCPVAGSCRARAAGVQEDRPAPRRRGPVRGAEFGVAVPVRRAPAEAGWKAALVRRPRDGMLGGLWEFPGAEMADREDGSTAACRAARIAGIAVDAPGRELPPVDHVYSHLKARYRPYLFHVRDRDPVSAGVGAAAVADGAPPAADSDDGPTWMGPAALRDAALPRAQRIIAENLEDVMGGRTQ